YETLSRHDRKSRHLAAAEAVSGGLGEEEMAEVIAAHLLAAYEAVPDAEGAEGLKARAAAALIRAGERAAGLAAAGEAQRYFEHALAALEAAGSEAEVAAVAAQLGRFLFFCGETERAGAHLERALALAELLDEPETLAQALNTKSTLLLSVLHRPREAQILLE